MADYIWPAALAPHGVEFYLQPHVGRSESPFTRQQKVYGLSAPRWVARLAFRGGVNGTSGLEAKGAALDGLIAKLKGGQSRVGFGDWRRPYLRGVNVAGASNNAAAIGASSMVLTGLVGSTVLTGDYIGGDGRAHIITEDATIAGGTATVLFEPPLQAAVGAGDATFGGEESICWFRLTDDEAGSNMTEVGEAVRHALEFVEDLGLPPSVATGQTIIINGITILIAGYDLEI